MSWQKKLDQDEKSKCLAGKFNAKTPRSYEQAKTEEKTTTKRTQAPALYISETLSDSLFLFEIRMAECNSTLKGLREVNFQWLFPLLGLPAILRAILSI